MQSTPKHTGLQFTLKMIKVQGAPVCKRPNDHKTVKPYGQWLADHSTRVSMQSPQGYKSLINTTLYHLQNQSLYLWNAASPTHRSLLCYHLVRQDIFVLLFHVVRLLHVLVLLLCLLILPPTVNKYMYVCLGVHPCTSHWLKIRRLLAQGAVACAKLWEPHGLGRNCTSGAQPAQRSSHALWRAPLARADSLYRT